MCKRLVALLAIAWTTTGVNVAGQQTWTGFISDSLCNASHMVMAQGVFPPLDNPTCVMACVDGGGKFVFMDKGDTRAPDREPGFRRSQEAPRRPGDGHRRHQG